jgi:hypothetical protein
MNWQFFVIVLFLTVISFVNTFLVMLAIRKIWGNEGTMGKYGKYILVPIVVVAYNFLTIASGKQWMYVVGAIPIIIMFGLFVYIKFATETDDAAKLPPKPLSNKSKRIHEARAKRHHQEQTQEEENQDN